MLSIKHNIRLSYNL